MLSELQCDQLTAAFSHKQDAVSAWRRWRNAIDWEGHLDFDSFALLPRLYRNLRSLDVEDDLLPRFKGVMRQNFYSNHRRLQQLEQLLDLLGEHRIDPILLPPTALLAHDSAVVFNEYIPHSLAIPADKAVSAIQELYRTGWKTARIRVPRWSIAGYVAAGEHLGYQSNNSEKLELRWPNECANPGGILPASSWPRSAHHSLGQRQVRILSVEDNLAYLLRQPVVNGGFRQISLVLQVLAGSGTVIDQADLSAAARERHFHPGWREALASLHPLLEENGIDMNDLKWLDEAVPDGARNTPGFLQNLGRHWGDYKTALGPTSSPDVQLCELTGYLMARWNLDTPGQIPVRALRGLLTDWRATPSKQ